MIPLRTTPARKGARCTKCRRWIHAGEQCLLGPFRCPTCPAWTQAEVDKLRADGILKPAEPEAATIAEAPSSAFVTVTDAKHWKKEIKEAEAEIALVAAQHKGYMKYNADGHHERHDYLCQARLDNATIRLAHARDQLDSLEG